MIPFDLDSAKQQSHGPLDQALADARAQHVDQRNCEHDDNDDGSRFRVLESADILIERLADASGAGDAEHGRGAHIGLEAVRV
jgi:hypothetical protein